MKHTLVLDQDEIDAVGHMGDFHADDEDATPFTRETLQRLRDKVEPLRSPTAPRSDGGPEGGPLR